MAAAHRAHRGEVRIADKTGMVAQTRQTPQTLTPAQSAESPDVMDPAPYLASLEAAERAIASGLGLRAVEVAWNLGMTTRGRSVRLGGILATRNGVNSWQLTRLDPFADSGDPAPNQVR